MKSPTVLLLLILCTLVSCTKQRIEGEVWIRVDNQTSKKLEDFRLRQISGAEGHDLRNAYKYIDPRSITAYRSHRHFSNIFSYEFLMPGYGQVGMELRCQVGMNALPEGKYSIVILEGTDFPEVYLQRD
jgi:hypothetical protein